jgi:transaldolase
MGLYIDSANLNDICKALELGFLTGVTTNPALIAKAGRPGLEILKEILAVCQGPVFSQVPADTAAGKMAQARDAAALGPDRVQVKIPATTENIGLAAKLANEGLLICVTAVSHPAQAYLAGQAGATYVAPYVNRLTRELGDGVSILRDCVEMVKGARTRIIAASLKSVDEVTAVLLAGADDVTIPLDLIMQLGSHPLSQKAIDDFDAAMRAAGL